MRKKKQNKSARKRHLIPANPILALLAIIDLLACVVFLSILILVDAFPGIYVVIILVMLAAAMVVLFRWLNCRKEITRQRKLGAIFSIVLIAVLCIGTYYLYSTYAMFNKISDNDKQTEEFHVVALKNGSYDDLKDIKGEELFVTDAESDTYKAAKKKLKKKADVTYKSAGGYIETGSKLIDKDGKKHDELIFVSNTYYEILCEEIDRFQSKTKIIYTISIDVDSVDTSKRVDVTKDPFNVYISGIDTFGSINTVARSDVNMIMTVDPKEKQILLTSIPRDMYVTLHTYGEKDKLTHTGIYGIDETVMTVEDWLDIDINYYIRVNFTTLVDIVDVIGGIDVESEYAFKSSVSEYSYAEGTNHLDGKAALFFARERKSLDGGDNERVKNQQRVLKGIINKVTTSPVILTRYTKLLNAVGDEMQTSLTEHDIAALVKMQVKDLGGWEIRMQSIKGNGTSAATYSMGSRQLYVAIPDEESVKAAQNEINEIMEQ